MEKNSSIEEVKAGNNKTAVWLIDDDNLKACNKKNDGKIKLHYQ